MKLGFLWLLMATVLTGVWFILLKKANEGIAPVVVQTFHVGGTLIALAIFLLISNRTLSGDTWHWGEFWYLAVIAGILIGTANIFMYLAFQTLPLSIVVPVLNLSCVIPILYGLAMLGEKANSFQKIGIGLAVAAFILITYPYGNRKLNQEDSKDNPTIGKQK